MPHRRRVAIKGSDLPESLLRLAGFLPDDDLTADVFYGRRGAVLNIRQVDPLRIGDVTSDLISKALRRDRQRNRKTRLP